MPFCSCEKKRLDVVIVFGRQQTIKNSIAHFWTRLKVIQISSDCRRTWRRSSKFLAANFFIPDAFSEKRRLVDLPNVGTCRYRLLKSWIVPSLCEIKIRMRCVKRAFHMPSSNSCIKSGTSMSKKLKPKGASEENAFWNAVIQYLWGLKVWTSYLCWCIRFLCQQTFHSCWSDSETSFINVVPRKWNIPVSIEVVHTSRFLTTSFVKCGTNFWNLAFWNKTSRAWTGTKVANRGKECSVTRWSSKKLSTP